MLFNFNLHYLFTRKIVTTEPALNGPKLFNEILSYFSETKDQNHKLWAEACPEERTLILSYTHNQSLSQPIHREPKDLDRTGTWAPKPFQKPRVHCPEDPVLKPLYYKWPSSNVFQIKLVLSALPHAYSPKPVILNLSNARTL